MRIMFFGTYVLNDAYPINKVLLNGIRESGVDVVECREDVWQGFLNNLLNINIFQMFPLIVRICLAYPRLILRYIRSTPCEVVVVGYPGYLDVLVARFLCLFSRRLLVMVSFISLYDTIVIDRQSIKPSSLLARFLYCVDKLAFRCSDKVLVDTKEVAKYYASMFQLPLNSFQKSFVGNVFEGMSVVKEKVKGQPFRVIFFGTYVPLHGVQFIIQAAIQLKNEPIEFLLIGNGQELLGIKEMADTARLEKVRFVDVWYSVEQLARVMIESDVCLGIFGDTEKASRVIPYKIFGALSLGCPVITRDSPAVRELLVDGESALFCNAGDGNALASSILQLFKDNELRQKIAEGGRICYHRHATHKAIGGEFLKHTVGANFS